MLALNAMIDPAFPRGAKLLEGAIPERSQRRRIRALIAAFKQCPSPMSHIIIEHFHGAASRVPVSRDRVSPAR